MARLLTCAVLGCLLVVSVVTTVNIAGVHPSEPFDRMLVLDDADKYILFWKYNASHVTFEVHVKTFGYVGFGISANGDMFPADVVIGWISNGTTHFADRHATDRVMPVKDTHEDWHLLHSEENDFGTVLKFVRKIDTCDTAEDIVIQDGTIHIIYSYNTNDPTSDDVIPYHGVRGTKDVWLLGATDQHTDLPSDVKYFDFLNRNIIVQPKKTYYHCSAFQMPDLGGKHHMIKYEPVITPGNERHVHHMIMYRCPGVAPSADGMQADCHSHVWNNVARCGFVIAGWAVGGQAFYFPQDTGFSFNDAGEPRFVFMETHYDNPHMKSGIMDDSGMRITLTRHLRPIDVGMMELGFSGGSELLVPPNEAAFVTKAYCSETCLRDAFATSNQTEIKIFASFQHAHLLSVGLRTRHFRNGTELKPVISEPNYDFDFQDMRLIETVTIKPGDSLSVECTYDSRGQTGPTFGGEGTHKEMCMNFVYYYPRLTISQCMSTPTYNAGMQYRSKELYNRFLSMDWDNTTVVADFKTELDNSPVFHHCWGIYFHDPHNSPASKMWAETGTQHPYVPPASDCS